MSSMEKATARPMAWLFLLFLVLACGVSMATLMQHPEVWGDEPLTQEDVLMGTASSAFESRFEDALLVRDGAIALWTSLTYGLFDDGGDGVVVGRDGWLYTDEEFRFLPEGEAAFEQKILDISKVKAVLAARGITLAVALIPAKARIYPEYLPGVQWSAKREAMYARMLAALQREDVLAPDLRPALQAVKADVPVFMKTDTHWSPQGAQLVANALADAILPVLQLDNGVRKAYVSQDGEAERYAGDLYDFIPTGIFSPVIGPEAEQVLTRSTTLQEDTGADSSDLFGEQVMPVVLVGTSYSFEKQWNFEGALASALQVDVLNLAEEGEGPMAPMSAFLQSDSLMKDGVRLVIWEIPERFVPVTYDAVALPEHCSGGDC